MNLTRGMETLLDEEDYEWALKYRWQAHICGGKFYASRATLKNKKHYTVYLHREIVGAAAGQQVDHKDGNTLNNKRDNLRIASQSQNNANMKRHSDGSSKFKGVYWDRDRNNFVASIGFNGRIIYIGSFKSEVMAGRAYNEKAKELFGEFARLNKIKTRREEPR